MYQNYSVTDPIVCSCQVVTGRFPTGHTYKSGQCTEIVVTVPQSLPTGGDSKDTNDQEIYDHFRPVRYICPECGLEFTGKSKLSYHMRTKHDNGRLECPQCACTFVSKAGLTQHVKHIHENLPRYQCETCGKGYSIRSNYYDHVATHTGVKRNVCPICKKQFTFKPGLNAHMLRVHPKQTPRV